MIAYVLSLIVLRIVLDTSVFVAALIRASAGPSSRVIRLCLERRCQAIMGDKLFRKFESVMSRASLFKNSPLSPEKRQDLFAGFANVCEWISVHYLWRPNLPDEGDNHVFELAIAGAPEHFHHRHGDLRAGSRGAGSAAVGIVNGQMDRDR